MLELYYYQKDAIDSIYRYFNNGKQGNPLIAMPTGTGKSLVIAEFIKSVLMQWPTQRILVCTHVKELLTQNSEELVGQWPNAPFGIMSAGLKQYNTSAPIVFGGVKTCLNAELKSNALGWRDLLIIDEAHLLSKESDSMYQKLIAKLKSTNPFLKVIGLTATPFRTLDGTLVGTSLFTDLIIDLTSLQNFNKLLAEGYLSPLYPKKTKVELDVSNVSMGKDDLNQKQLQAAVDQHDINQAACAEMVEYGKDCKSWLVFASGIEHAEHIAKILRNFGVPSVAVHSNMDRTEAVKAFKAGHLRCLVSFNVVTTGFNHKPVDFIGMLRPTASTGLWVQMLGRGTRPCEGKNGCLVLDFAGNTRRLGPINDPVIPKRKGGGAGDAPVKVCAVCGTYNAISARFCIKCATEFSFAVKLTQTADTTELIRSDLPTIEVFEVERVTYSKIDQPASGKPSFIRAGYVCKGLRHFEENVMLEHEGFASKRGRDWWRARAGTEAAPPSINDAWNYRFGLKIPKYIHVHTNKYFNGKNVPEIIKAEGFHNVN